MRNLPFGRLTFCVWIALLAGCGGALSPGPSGSASGIAALPSGVRSLKAQALLYISDLGANAVDVYTYPQGESVTSFTGFGSVAGLCSDKAGDVFVVDETGPIDVYAHGGTTPIRKLGGAGTPYGCSVDPVTGNLAVTQLSSSENAFAVYPKANGKPKIYVDKQVDVTWFCGYDDKGNLFADAWDRYGHVILVELPKGGKSVKNFKLGETFENPGGTMWDGSYVAIANRGAGVVYRSGETGRAAHTVKLKNDTNVEQFWIDGSTLIGPNEDSPGTVGFWHYPAGGAPFKTLKGFYTPFGATVSVAR